MARTKKRSWKELMRQREKDRERSWEDRGAASYGGDDDDDDDDEDYEDEDYDFDDAGLESFELGDLQDSLPIDPRKLGLN